MRAAGGDGGSEMQKTVMLCFQTCPWEKKAAAAAPAAAQSYTSLFKKKYSAYQTQCTNQCRQNHTIMELCQGLQIIQCIKYFFYLLQHFPSLLNVGVKHCTFSPLTLQQLWCHYGRCIHFIRKSVKKLNGNLKSHKHNAIKNVFW